MRSRFLFPYWSRYAGLACILLHIPLMMLFADAVHNSTDHEGLFNPKHVFFIATTLMVTVGLFLVAFSRERIEDEQIVKLRRDSLYYAVYVNYFLLIAVLVFTSKMEFTHIMELNMWVPLVFFIIRFRWVIYRLNRSARGEA